MAEIRHDGGIYKGTNSVQNNFYEALNISSSINIKTDFFYSKSPPLAAVNIEN